MVKTFQVTSKLPGTVSVCLGLLVIFLELSLLVILVEWKIGQGNLV